MFIVTASHLTVITWHWEMIKGKLYYTGTCTMHPPCMYCTHIDTQTYYTISIMQLHVLHIHITNSEV